MRRGLRLLQAAIGLAVFAPVAADAAQELRQPNTYAVVIGISQYREEVIPKVAYAVKDAEAVARLLATQGGIPKTNIKLLTDAKATVGDFRNHLGEWLRMRVKPDSTVYVYYAGHGTPNSKTGEAALVPWDGHPDFPAGLYPLKELYESLNKLPAKDVIVLLDSCFSGSPGRSVLAQGARPLVLSMENPLLAAGKVVVLAAASGTQISSDYEKAGHGLFTHYLLQGLQGDADADKDGIVTLKEVVPYVQERVAKTAVDELNREQTPTLLPGEEALKRHVALPLTLAVAEKAAPKVQTSKPDPGSGAAVAELEQKLKALEQEERRVDDEKKAAALQKQIEEKRKAPIEEARVRPYEAPKDLTQEITGRDDVPMVLVPAGEFLYGVDNRRVSLSAFYMDLYEITTNRYAAFLQATGLQQPRHWDAVRPASDGDLPVTGVDWHDAGAYCHYYGKRLPTEQEWEKAARGTDGRTYPWGNAEPSAGLANFNQGVCGPFCNVYEEKLKPVNSYPGGKSPYGVYNMLGNVLEWTSSDYNSSDKVIRGGSWTNPRGTLSSTFRSRRNPTFGVNTNGFRCAQDIPR